MKSSILFAGILSLAAASAAHAAGDPAAGKSKFIVCTACHSVAEGAPKKMGPNLFGVVGRKAGAGDPAFTYSPALKGSNLTWTEANLDKWLSGPAKLVPGNRMAFPGLPDAQDRANVIAYLKAAK